MNEQKIAIESLAMDLKRIAIGLHRGSVKMAERFRIEALKREDEIEAVGISDIYLHKLVSKSRSALTGSHERVAEDALMYSTLFQNYAQRKYDSRI